MRDQPLPVALDREEAEARRHHHGRAVADLRVVQAPITRQKTHASSLRREPERIDLPDVTNPALRAALERMAHGIVMRKGS